jgi:hypothetical protein
VRKLTEAEAALEKRASALEAQLQHERSEHARALSASDERAAATTAQIMRQQEALLHARKVNLAALRARSKADVVDAALAALSAGLPGVSAYVAELQSSHDATISTALTTVQQAADLDPASPLAAALASLDPAFLSSPLSEGVPGVDGLNGEDVSPPQSDGMLLKYKRATAGQAFMIGQELDMSKGVSWAAIRSGQPMYTPEVTHEPGIHCFKCAGCLGVWDVCLMLARFSARHVCKHRRKTQMHSRADQRPSGYVVMPYPVRVCRSDAAPAGGAYLAVPIKGMHGEVVGLIGVDTMVHKSAAPQANKPLDLGNEDAQFVQQVADIVSEAIAGDQRQLQALLEQVRG